MIEYSRELAAIKMIRNYDDLQTRYDSLMKEAMGMRVASDKLAKRHAWTPGMGDCICQPHLDTHEAIASFDRFLDKENPNKNRRYDRARFNE